MQRRYMLNQSEIFLILTSKISFESEEVWILSLGPELQILSTDLIFKGTVDHCPFHPRDIFRKVLRANASAFILCHSHPSGNCLPSNADLKITQRLYYLSLLMEIPLLDHLIITQEKAYSLKQSGYFSIWARMRPRSIHKMFDA